MAQASTETFIFRLTKQEKKQLESLLTAAHSRLNARTESEGLQKIHKKDLILQALIEGLPKLKISDFR